MSIRSGLATSAPVVAVEGEEGGWPDEQVEVFADR